MVRMGLGFALGAALVLGCATTGKPEPVRNYGFAHDVHSDVKQVSLGHFVGPFEKTGICLAHVGTKDEEAGALHVLGTVDQRWITSTEIISCSYTGTSTCTYLDGSATTEAWTGECHAERSGHVVIKTNGVFVSGTGRFAGIQGTTWGTSWDITSEPEFASYSVTSAKYTVPPK